MPSRFLSWTIDPAARPFLIFAGLLAVSLAVFLGAMGLGPDSLPFPPESDFSDAVTSHWPGTLFLKQSVREDHAWPLWRPLIMSGQPFAANPLNKTWYPPQWLVIILPPVLHLNLLTWLHLVLAGAGAWAWGRASGLLPWAAALAGLGYAFSPRLIASTGGGHLDLVYAAAWVPWLLWAVHRVTRPDAGRWSAVGLGAFAALCFLADVRLSGYAFALAGAYLAWEARQTHVNLRQIGPNAISAALLAAGLTAFQWVPLLLLRGDLSRNTITLDDAAVHSLDWGQWLGLLIGDYGGSWETLVYAGVSTLVLAITALLLRSRALGCWGLALAVVALYAMGDNFILWPALNWLVPALRWWRVPPRAWLLAALILPYLAGWGAQLLITRPPDRRSARLAVAALLGSGLACSLSGLVMLSSALKTRALLGTFALPAVAGIMWLAIERRLPARRLGMLLALVVLADVLWIDQALIEGRHRETWLAPYRELATYLDDAGATRVYSPSYSLPQQAAAYWHIPLFGGVDPFQLSAYVAAAEAATGVPSRSYSVTIPPYEVEAVEGKALSESDILATANRDATLDADRLGAWLVTHVVSAFEIEADGLEFEARLGDVHIYRNTRAPQVTLDWDGPHRVTVQATAPVNGTLYAVAGGRWDGHDELPGLPGAVDGQTQSWTYHYSTSEVWISLLVASVLIGLAALVSMASRWRWSDA